MCWTHIKQQHLNKNKYRINGNTSLYFCVLWTKTCTWHKKCKIPHPWKQHDLQQLLTLYPSSADLSFILTIFQIPNVVHSITDSSFGSCLMIYVALVNYYLIFHKTSSSKNTDSYSIMDKQFGIMILYTGTQDCGQNMYSHIIFFNIHILVILITFVNNTDYQNLTQSNNFSLTLSFY